MRRPVYFAGITATLSLAGCASHHAKTSHVEPISPPKVVVAHKEELPAYRSINKDLSSGETNWHLRSALNVAALSCPERKAITVNYNKLLKSQKALLNTAYRAEESRWGATRDTHITQVYNFFAQPSAKLAFCSAASDIAERATIVKPNDFDAFAERSLARLDGPFHQVTTEESPVRLVSYTKPAAAPPIDRVLKNGAWLVQLGAFEDRSAASAAWEKARTKISGLATLQPSYQDVANKKLVRLQAGPLAERDDAAKLCKAAGAYGQACIPVANNP